MSSREEFIEMWNAQADGYNTWDSLDEEEKINFVILKSRQQMKQECLAICESYFDKDNECAGWIHSDIDALE